MKKLIFFFSLLLTSAAVFAQEKQPASPPATATATIAGKKISIEYAQPSVKGRKIWGGLVPYGEVWRAGANASTSIATSADMMIEGKNLPKGKYAFFVIPNEKEWTIIINKTIAWGAYDYKKAEDVLRVNVPVKKTKAFTEKMTFEVLESGEICLSWANEMACIKVK